ncbi:hypothetical protein N008_11715 [Hymenobacter sp. APR13]|nr:hypothetical protein N008_11715 [Hymenobacter sp. APR13]
MRVQLKLEPATHRFTCHYTFRLPASDTSSVLKLNLNRQFQLQQVRSTGAARPRTARLFYPFFGDTLQQVTVRFGNGPARRQVELTYVGTLGKGNFTADVNVLSGHSNWLPFRPYAEYEVVDYELAVRVPTGYQVLSTTAPRRERAGSYAFRGSTSATELTAIVARQFGQLVAGSAPRITVVKAAAAPGRADSVLLQKTQDIVAFYNRSIGRQDAVAQFTVFLPGTNHEAYGLLDNATVITYTDFDVAKRGDLLILDHEISHKWWAYGSYHDDSAWLNEAFATYSSLLYLQASGDAEGYRQELAKLATSAAGAPPILGFNRYQHEPAVFRRVVYNKGTVILAALHDRLGTESFNAVLAATAARQVSTTAGFLEVVAQLSGQPTRDWLLAELSR